MKIKSQFSTPVLFLIFNRPDHTKKVFLKIKEARPTQLFIAADGPRDSVDTDKLLCVQTREIINLIDWECNVKTLFRDQNLGCRYAISTAIDWFFEQVEEGIILEDDCLPDPTFFTFCEAMLSKYRVDEEIFMIHGNNYQRKQAKTEESYYFSKIPHVWGWATWKRAWMHYDHDMISFLDFLESGDYKTVYKEPFIRTYYLNCFFSVFEKKVDTWDYTWVFTIARNNGLVICPHHNLIRNIGFDVGTHVTEGQSSTENNNVYSISTIIHPAVTRWNKKLDEQIYKNIFNVYGDGFLAIFGKLRKIIKLQIKIRRLLHVKTD